MFLDASAIVAILARERDAGALKEKLAAAKPPLYVSALTVYEATMGLARAKTRRGSAKIERPSPTLIAQAQDSVVEFLSALDVKEVSIQMEIGRYAIEAAKRYGTVVGSPADLNFGDCFAYACAKACRVPLLYKGSDFAQTDLA